MAWPCWDGAATESLRFSNASSARGKKKQGPSTGGLPSVNDQAVAGDPAEFFLQLHVSLKHAVVLIDRLNDRIGRVGFHSHFADVQAFDFIVRFDAESHDRLDDRPDDQ